VEQSHLLRTGADCRFALRSDADAVKNREALKDRSLPRETITTTGSIGVMRLRTESISTIVLILSNIVPLWGVLFWGWDIFALMLLFWLENVVIGIFNVGRMATAPPYTVSVTTYQCFLIPFFVVHYGIFTLVHGVFVFVLFLPKTAALGTSSGSAPPTPTGFLTAVLDCIPPMVPLALLAIILSHGASFFLNFLWRGERFLTDLDTLMMAPYRRVVLLYLTLLAGSFIVIGLGTQKPSIAVFVLLKIMIDVMAHLAERNRYASKKIAADGEAGTNNAAPV